MVALLGSTGGFVGVSLGVGAGSSPGAGIISIVVGDSAICECPQLAQRNRKGRPDASTQEGGSRACSEPQLEQVMFKVHLLAQAIHLPWVEGCYWGRMESEDLLLEAFEGFLAPFPL